MLLGGLFFYDVFWVFGTDVMVTVAKVCYCAILLIGTFLMKAAKSLEKYQHKVLILPFQVFLAL